MVLIACGNSLLDTVVFGKIVGREAAKFAKKEGNEISKVH